MQNEFEVGKGRLMWYQDLAINGNVNILKCQKGVYASKMSGLKPKYLKCKTDANAK